MVIRDATGDHFVCNGLEGAAGIPGSTGAVGPAGERGPQGPQGAAGRDGDGAVLSTLLSDDPDCPGGGVLVTVAGVSVPVCDGADGGVGASGAVGAQGPQGASGLAGAQGVAGPEGARGAQGFQGSQGTIGASGVQGVAGAMGAQGVQGAQGLPGAQGFQGFTGAQGAAGAVGAQGAAGVLASGGAAGAVPYWDGTSWILNSTNVFHDGARVGVGTTAPAATLDVNGGIRVGADAGACSASKAGTIRWWLGAVQACDGSAWVDVGRAPTTACSGTGKALQWNGTAFTCVDVARSYADGGTAHGGRIVDAWSNVWDASERAPMTWSAASATCQSLGGRLPLVTELWRVSAAQTGEVGHSWQTNYLWALNHYDATLRMIVRSSDGHGDVYTDASPLRFRCVWPSSAPLATFTGTACQGPPDQECYPSDIEGRRYNVDKYDRAPQPMSSARFECAFLHAHLAPASDLIRMVEDGLPNGSNAWLWTTDEVSAQHSMVVRWSGTPGSSYGPTGNTSYDGDGAFHEFRCLGVNYVSGAFPNTVANEDVATTTYLKGEVSDTAATSIAPAISTCNSRGGHLPMPSDYGELILGGLTGGSAAWLQTADHSSSGGTPLHGVIQWTGTNQRWAGYYSDQSSCIWSNSFTLYPYRCVYYPIDTSYSGPSACNGGATACFTVTYGTGLSQPGKVWIDPFDRSPATFPAAIEACKAAGARIAHTRDFTETIRAGLGNGSGNYLWTSDLVGTDAAATVKWSGTQTAYNADTNASGLWDFSHHAFGTSLGYRCVWTNELR